MDRGPPRLVAEWKLLRLDRGDGSLRPPIEGTELTAQFRGDGHLGGSAGCNRYMATYEVDDASLSINPQIASTQMWCEHPEGTMAQEGDFLRAWSRVVGFGFRADHLELLNAEGETVLIFARAGETTGGPAEEPGER